MIGVSIFSIMRMKFSALTFVNYFPFATQFIKNDYYLMVRFFYFSVVNVIFRCYFICFVN